jgi:hypothetical protein
VKRANPLPADAWPDARAQELGPRFIADIKRLWQLPAREKVTPIVSKTFPRQATIPVRAMNRPVTRAHVLGNCVTWHCVCGLPTALQGRSGPSGGPTPDTVVVCSQCHRVYFVIPLDRSFGPPIEVVELFGIPEPATAAPAAVNPAEAPSAPTEPGER